MNEFSDRPFVAGSIVGLRSFRVDSLHVWRPGENVGECKRYEEARKAREARAQLGHLQHVRHSGSSVFVGMPHEVGSLACKCGFYAYFDTGKNDWHGGAQGEIYGVVSGYGIVTVGSRGFRAQKAKLLGLVARRKLGNVSQLVADLYGVPLFGSKQEAVERFPLTPPPLPNPATDDDFWTRSAS